MKKYIKLIIPCITLMLYCCGDKQVNSGASMRIQIEREKRLKEQRKAEEQQNKYKSLINAINVLLVNIRPHEGFNFPNREEERKRFTNFKTWLENNPEKQQELANEFTKAYDHLISKKQQYEANNNIPPNNESFDDYIKNGILTNEYNHKNRKYGTNVRTDVKDEQGKIFNTFYTNKNLIYQFFRNLVDMASSVLEADFIPITNNEKMFETMISSMRNNTKQLLEEWE